MDIHDLPEQHHLTRTDNLMTLQSHILAEEAKHPNSTGTLSWILSAMSFSAKMIASKIRRARLNDVLGSLDSDNVQGERQQKLDVIANETLQRCLGARAGVAIVASEENEEPIVLRSDASGDRKYVVLFDPLDGSANLDACGGVGTIFSVLRHDRRVTPERSILQPGAQQVAAGYILYGSSVVFVLTTGSGVDMFVLDPSIGAFLKVEEHIHVPQKSKNYSLNEGNRKSFPAGYQNYLDWAQSNGYSSRYAGAMVADVHRILLKGGVFLYPPTAKAPKGKLRLM
jgi:fructose-1,6-bisphosphatase I